MTVKTLEEKIQAILGEAKGDALKTLAKDYDDADDKDEKDSKDSEDQNDNDDDEKDDEDTDVSKDKAEVKESSVPGTDAVLGTKASEKLKDAESQLSGTEKTSKLTSKYNKGTKQGKLSAEGQSGSSDEKASSETSKITSAYKTDAMPKLKAEAFEALFSGETLTEEFKVKAEAIFEAAVAQVAEERIEELLEEHQLQLTEAVEEVKGELVEQIDGYLDHVIEQWMEDNAVALESGIKVEMVSSFMENLKSVFTEHYIEVPASKVDVVEEQAQTIEKLQAELAEAKEAQEVATNESSVLKCDAIVAEAKSGLTDVQAMKLQSMAENVEFDTEEEFAAKVSLLKEAYFNKDIAVKTKTQDTTKADSIVEAHSDVEAVMKVLRNDSLKLIKSSN